MPSRSFPFINDHFRLYAIKKNGKKYIALRYFYTKAKWQEIKIQCTHTVLAEIPAQAVVELPKELIAASIYGNTEQKDDQPIAKLTKEDDFIALVSWVEGIANEGLNGFMIQNQIETAFNDRVTSIVMPMMQFVANFEESVFNEYVHLITEQCKFENEWHLPSLQANLLILIDIITRERIPAKQARMFQCIMDQHFPIEVFKTEDIRDDLCSLFVNPTIKQTYADHPVRHLIRAWSQQMSNVYPQYSRPFQFMWQHLDGVKRIAFYCYIAFTVIFVTISAVTSWIFSIVGGCYFVIVLWLIGLSYESNARRSSNCIIFDPSSQGNYVDGFRAKHINISISIRDKIYHVDGLRLIHAKFNKLKYHETVIVVITHNATVFRTPINYLYAKILEFGEIPDYLTKLLRLDFAPTPNEIQIMPDISDEEKNALKMIIVVDPY